MRRLIGIVAGALWYCIAAGAQTQVDIGGPASQAKRFDLSQAPSTRPVKTGTTAPATCVTGELFFKSDALTAGQNLYGCTAVNTWTLLGDGGTGGGGGAVSSVFGRTGAVVAQSRDYSPAQLGCDAVRTSSTVLTIFTGASGVLPCVVRIGSVTYSFIAPATVTLAAGAGSGTLRLHVSETGTLTAGHNLVDVSVTCAGCTKSGGLSSFPSTSVPLATWTATADSWDIAGGLDLRAVIGSAWPVTAGAGLQAADAGGVRQLAVNPAAYPALTGEWNATAGTKVRPARHVSSDPGTCEAGEQIFNTTANTTKQCGPANTWTSMTGGGGSGYSQAQNSGVNLTQRSTLNFRSGLTAADATTRSDVRLDPFDLSETRIDEEFCASNGSTTRWGALNWQLSIASGNAVDSATSGEAQVSDAPCILRLTTAATSGDRIGVGNVRWTGLTSKNWKALWRFRITSVVTGVHLRVGLSNDMQIPFGVGGRMAFHLRYNSASDSAFVMIRNNNGTESTQCTATGGPVQNQWYKLIVTGSGSATVSVQLLNEAGTDQFTTCSGTIDSPSDGLGPYFALETSDTTAKILETDAYKARIEVTR